MNQKIHAGILLVHSSCHSFPISSLQDLELECTNNLDEAKEKIKISSYPVLIFSIQSSQVKELMDILQIASIHHPNSQIVLIVKNLDQKEVQNILYRFDIFRLVKDFNDPNFSLILFQALEKYQWCQQNSDFLKLLIEHNKNLFKEKVNLEKKIEKKQKYLERTKRKMIETNQQAEVLHACLIAINLAKNIKELEQNVRSLLTPYLELSHTEMTFAKIDEISLKEKFYFCSFPLESSHFHLIAEVGSIYFFRTREKSNFNDQEIDFLQKISEAICLAFDRFQVLDQLYSLKSQWEATFDAIAQPLCITDSNYQVLKLNRAFMRVCGRPYQDLIGKNCFTSLETNENKIIKNDLMTESSIVPEKTYRLSISNGQYLDQTSFDVQIQPIHFNSNGSKGFFIFFRDITNQLHLERQILESTKIVELGTISSSIAHELNNPIGGMLSFLQLIQKELPAESLIREDILAMQTATIRCKEIVENLLGFAHQEESDNPALFDLCEVIQQSLKILELQTRSRGIKIQFSTSEENKFFIEGQTQQIGQSIRNILQNSIDAVNDRMDKDPGYQGVIRVHVNAQNAKVCLEVSDNGFGIKETDQKKIYNPLYSTRTSSHHVGLGLTVALNIITDHQGTLEISSVPGTGTFAKISFPRPDFSQHKQVFDAKI